MVTKVKIDGCVIDDNNVKKCDCLLYSDDKRIAVFIELKGRKLEDALEQLAATLDNDIVKTKLGQYR